ncbi:Pkh1p [Rhizophagus irregularis DAOM 197198w]|uniref:Pkh1p n=2 Tax=Rhizophagus irregularis TaxID=588596 RepID=A0A015K612_RHIIW|nr:Pkh1p [Rhizophagus irregularis DAOM 197198w]
MNKINKDNKWIRWIKDSIANKYINYHDYDEFQNLEYICDRRFSKVHRANWKSLNNIVTLKSLKNGSNFMKEIVNEITLLNKINLHKNIIQFFGITKMIDNNKDNVDPNYLFIFEYADNGTLRDYLENNFNNLDWNIKLRFAIQIVDAVSFIHRKNIIHRNLHSNSILVHKNMIKLDDFGLSHNKLAEVSNTSADIIGILPFIDPQHFKEKLNDNYKANKKSDVYSVGVLLWEISSGKRPFESYNKPHQKSTLMLEILNGRREIPTSDTQIDYVNTYKRCWQDNPNDRPDMQQVLSELKSINLNMKNDLSYVNKINENIHNDTIIDIDENNEIIINELILLYEDFIHLL